MAQQCKGISRGKQQRPNRRGRSVLWVVLPFFIIAGVVVAVLALFVAGPPPSASPLPVRTLASPSAVSEAAHIEAVADIVLFGGALHFDYQSLDPGTRLLFWRIHLEDGEPSPTQAECLVRLPVLAPPGASCDDGRDTNR